MVNIGIIGAGRMGNLHAGHLSTIENVKLAGIYDIDPNAAKTMQEKFGTRIYNSARELVQSDDINAILIASPTYCHYEGITEALAVGKHIFCEKPLVRTMAEADKLFKKIHNFKGKFAVGFVRRHAPEIRLFKELIDKGTIGIPRLCNISLMHGSYARQRGSWFADFDACGGVILDMLAHHLDLLNWFFGNADRVYADSWLLDQKLQEPADYVSATITFKNKVICNIESGWLRFGRSSDFMEVYGDEGSLSYSWGARELIHYTKLSELKKLTVNKSSKVNFYKLEMLDFVDSIISDRIPNTGLEDGYKSLNLAISMIKSTQEKDKVCLCKD